MNRSHHIRLVCFDLGGVVVRICRSWAEGCAVAGLDVRATLPRNADEMQRWHELGMQYQLGAIDGHTFARRMSEAMDGLYSPEEVRAVDRAWILGEYDGIETLVGNLRAAGLETAALSNTSHDHWQQLLRMPAIARMDHRLGSHQLGLTKPDPAVYRALEHHTGRRASEIIFFDDLQENVQGARRCAWTAAHIDHAGDPAEQIRAALEARGVLRSSAV